VVADEAVGADGVAGFDAGGAAADVALILHHRFLVEITVVPLTWQFEAEENLPLPSSLMIVVHPGRFFKISSAFLS
jgi:hypothetical protein